MLERRHALPVVAAAACAVGLVVVGRLALDVPAAQDRDVAILHGFTGLDRPRVNDGLVAVGHLVDPLPYALGGLACIAVAIARGRRWRALAVGAVLVATGLSAQALKHGFAEQRFAAWLGYGQIDAASWPSGHATAAMTLALCAVLVASPAWRGLVALLGGGCAVAVAYATLALAWHYPSDVLAGFLLAGLWVSVAVAVLQRVEPEGATARRAVPWERLVAFGGLGALGAVALVAAASDGVAQYATARTTLVAGALTIAALALALVTSVVVAE
ncbi:MAG: phosphatase PAP2 family protein [Solirubrobacteraceae bacterium]